jgi:signal transduction histidine kinase
VTGKIPGFQMEKRFVRKNGEIFWGRVTYSVVPDKDGQPEYLVGIIEDVTQQREADQKLAEQDARYRRTLEKRVEERTHELADANLRLLDEIEQRKRAEEALATKAAEDAVTAERTRLARDLHDAVTQTLFAASLIAEVLPDLWAMDAEEAQKSTEELRQMTRGALAEMRTLLLELRPATLTQSKLSELIRQLCEALIGRARLPINLTIEGDRSLPPEVQVAFYRIAQESLNNVFKYARATKVDVGLFLTNVGAHLEVCDNGVGFDMSATKATSLGLRIMRERAEAIGAELSIVSEPGKGVCLDVDWIEKPDMKLSVFKK